MGIRTFHPFFQGYLGISCVPLASDVGSFSLSSISMFWQTFYLSEYYGARLTAIGVERLTLAGMRVTAAFRNFYYLVDVKHS